MIFFDPMYIVLLLPGMLLALWASYKVRSAFHQGMRYAPASGLTGAEAAQEVLHDAGIYNVPVEVTQGYMSDHYDPSERTLRLSPDVYYGRSLSALGVAAHEAGHALQHAEKYTLLSLRNAIVPLASIGSSLSMIVILVGFVLLWANLLLGYWVVWVGIGLFSLIVLFQVINLPVEFDASRRARLLLLNNGMVTPQEDVVVGKVLNAAAMTYVAATLTAILELLYWVLRATALSNRD
jgi:hypothetical protein